MADEDDLRREAEEEEAYNALYREIGPEWARDHAYELFQENYEEAVSQFTTERLQSYYLKHPDLILPSHEALQTAQLLIASHPDAALVFATTSSELTITAALLRPIVYGLVHTEALASIVTELILAHRQMDRYRQLLTRILADFGGIDLTTYKRVSSKELLSAELNTMQSSRHSVVHRGEKVATETPELSIKVARALLEDIFPKVLKAFDLYLDSDLKIKERGLDQK
jgi:hypothetical protein